MRGIHQYIGAPLKSRNSIEMAERRPNPSSPHTMSASAAAQA
jgi:hypothetical protein